MNRTDLPYFAYGSNMNLGQMARRCPGSVRLGRAVLPDYRFLINETGYATIEPALGDRVEGVLWRILEPHHAALDEYEEHCEGIYDRCFREVRNGEGEGRMALVYIDHLRTRTSSPNPGYLERVIQGARENDLSEEYIETLQTLGGDR